MRKKLQLLWLFSILLLALVGCSSTQKSAYEVVGIEEVPALMKEGKTVLDVREVLEYEEGHIIGAINKPLSEIQKSNFDGIDIDTEYVVICRSGNRSVTASDLLSKEGYSVINVSEGMSSWTGPVQ